MEPSLIKRMYDALVMDRKTIEQTWDLIEQYIMPLHGGKFFQDMSSEHEMEWRRPEVFDDTAILGAEQLAASLHGSLASPATQWFGLGHRDKALMQDQEVKDWLDECAQRMYSTIQDSNFDVEAPIKFLDLVGFGNGCILMEPLEANQWRGVRFDALNLRQLYFELDSDSSIHRLYRRLEWTVVQIADKFGRENLPQALQGKLDTPQAVDQKYTVIFCVYKREDKDANMNSGARVAPLERPYAYKYVFHNDGSMLGEEGGYHEMPVFFTRMRRATGSHWGFGPGNIALPTTITINTYVELVLKAAEKAIDPAILATERGLLSQLDLGPAALNVVKDLEKSIKMFESAARFDVSALQIDDLRQQVRRIFKVDQLELKESPAMTAAEVYVRYELMNRLLGPSLGQIKNDWFDRMIQTLFNMMYRAGQLPEVPQAVQDSQTGVMQVEYVGPMNRSQRMEGVGAVERWLQNLAQIAAVDQEIMLAIDSYAIAIGIGDDLDVPSQYYKPRKEFDADVKELRQQQARQAQAEAAAKEAQAAGAGGVVNINQRGLQQGTGV